MSDLASPPSQPGDSTPGPVPTKKAMSGCLVFALGTGFGVVLVAGVLALIAFTQYGDYVVRSQVSEGSSLADGVKTAIGEYYLNNGAFPPSNRDADLPEAHAINGQYVSYVDAGKQPGHIEIGFSSQSPQRAHRSIAGKHLWFDAAVKDGVISWSCRSNELRQKDCPRSCACSG